VISDVSIWLDYEWPREQIVATAMAKRPKVLTIFFVEKSDRLLLTSISNNGSYVFDIFKLYK
jgi:hypothetical protein